MRMKRFLSLMLAVVMLASLTISASAASKVYYVQDFSGYTDDSGNLDINKLMDAIIVKSGANSIKTLAATELRDTNSKNMITVYNYVNGAISATRSAFTADSNNINWLRFQTASGSNGGFYVVANNLWDYTAASAANETYVISYDIKVEPSGKQTTQAIDNPVDTLWTDGTATASDKADRVFALRAETADAGVTDYATVRSSKGSQNATETMSANVAHKMAVGYKYTDGLTYPFKTVAIDGVVKAESTGAGNATSATPKLAGFALTHSHQIGQSISNIKMYTIDNGGMNVSSTVTETVPTTTTTVPVKFSQPVYAASFNPADVTVSKTNASGTTELKYNTDFTVSGLTEEVGNVNEEICSKATVKFTKALEEASEYVITFPEDITNEIGTAIAGNTVTFNTPAPAIVVGNKIITKAWGTASAENVGAFAKEEAVYGASLDITNTTENNKAVAVIYAVYAGGKLKDVVYANDTIAAKATATIGAGVELSSDVTAVKAFIWDGITSLKPSAESTVWNITE